MTIRRSVTLTQKSVIPTLGLCLGVRWLDQMSAIKSLVTLCCRKSVVNWPFVAICRLSRLVWRGYSTRRRMSNFKGATSGPNKSRSPGPGAATATLRSCDFDRRIAVQAAEWASVWRRGWFSYTVRDFQCDLRRSLNDRSACRRLIPRRTPSSLLRC